MIIFCLSIILWDYEQGFLWSPRMIEQQNKLSLTGVTNRFFPLKARCYKRQTALKERDRLSDDFRMAHARQIDPKLSFTIV